MTSSINPIRGEIWEVRFDPSEGDEIRKVRPAIVISVASAGKMQLRIVVPVTGWQSHFERYFWMVNLPQDESNGLAKESTADCFQTKSLSLNRFTKYLGTISNALLDEITTAVTLCIGYKSSSSE